MHNTPAPAPTVTMSDLTRTIPCDECDSSGEMYGEVMHSIQRPDALEPRYTSGWFTCPYCKGKGEVTVCARCGAIEDTCDCTEDDFVADMQRPRVLEARGY